MEKIFNENAIDVLDRMIAKNYKVDLIATDPPYKVTTRGGYTNAGGMMLDEKMRKGNVFNENTLTIKEWLPKLYQVLKDTGHCYIMCNNKNLYPFLDAVNDSEFHLVKTMIWAKDNKIMSQAYMSQFEFILFLRKGAFVKINNCGTSDLLQFPNQKTKGEDGKPIHPTEKPIDLMKVLIENSSKENEIVLDPFLGVGTTAIASKELNRGFIGIELDENYFNISLKRVEETSKNNETAQLGIGAVSSRLSLHVHNDIEDAAKWYKIPLVFWNKESVYVMQEDRCVFVGNPAAALQFITYNEGKYCQSRFPLNGL